MSYFKGMGLGLSEELGLEEELGEVAPGPSMAVPWWCSPAVPQSGCVAISGVAKPMNVGTLTLFQMIQRRLNALLAKRKKSLVMVDGRIGPSTVLAMRAVSSSPASITGPDVIAQNSLELVAALEAQMATEGAPSVPDPSGAKPPAVKPDGTIDNSDKPGFKLSPTAMVVVAISIGAVLAIGGKKKGRRR